MQELVWADRKPLRDHPYRHDNECWAIAQRLKELGATFGAAELRAGLPGKPSAPVATGIQEQTVRGGGSQIAFPIPNGLYELLSQVRAISPGRIHSSEFEEAIEVLLTAIFSPVLTDPECQCPIHENRKRIDITYRNAAIGGFFRWLAVHYAAAHIFVEAKNYGKDVANPELDQLAGRFSEQRGTVGILVCRGFENKDHFLRRCRDTANDKRGFIIPVDDGDLEVLVRGRTDPNQDLEFPLFRDRFKDLVMNRIG